MLKPLLIMGEGMEARAARAHGSQEERLRGVCPLAADSLVPHEVDYDRLLASLKNLGELVEDGDTQVEPMPRGAQAHGLEPIPLKLYRNGIMVFDGPFRPFHDPSTQVRAGGREDRPLCSPLCSSLVGDGGAQFTPMGTQSYAKLAEFLSHLC